MDPTTTHSAKSLAGHHAAPMTGIRWRGVIRLALLSLAIGLVVPWVFVTLLEHAEAACHDLDAMDELLLFGLWVVLALASSLAFFVGNLVAWKLPIAARIAVGVVPVLAVCLVATGLSVPQGNASDYPAVASGQCGPGGVPTWWPAFLPHH